METKGIIAGQTAAEGNAENDMGTGDKVRGQRFGISIKLISHLHRAETEPSRMVPEPRTSVCKYRQTNITPHLYWARSARRETRYALFGT